LREGNREREETERGRAKDIGGKKHQESEKDGIEEREHRGDRVAGERRKREGS